MRDKMKRKSKKRKDQGLAFNIWALARAPDLRSNIYQVESSSNNSIQHPMIDPRRLYIPDALAARALNKDTWNVTVPDSLPTRRRPKNGKMGPF